MLSRSPQADVPFASLCQVVALGNLLPSDQSVDELDSHMYQTVGHQVLAGYAAGMGLPLFRRQIHGTSIQKVRHQSS